MLAATIDFDGSIRICPGSTASLQVVREPSGAIQVTNLSEWPVCLNGEGVARHGQEQVHLAPGARKRFVPLEAAVG